MDSQNYWINRIETLEKEINRLGKQATKKRGFKLILSPWDSIKNTNVAFLSHYPKIMSESEREKNERVVSVESDNDAEIKKYLSSQFYHLMKYLKVNPSNVLTGFVTPFKFRNIRSESFSQEQKDEIIDFGKAFWSEQLYYSTIQHIILNGIETEQNVVLKIFNLDEQEPDNEEIHYRARLSNLKFRFYNYQNGKKKIYFIPRFPRQGDLYHIYYDKNGHPTDLGKFLQKFLKKYW